MRELAYLWRHGTPDRDDAIEFYPHRKAAREPTQIAIGIDGIIADLSDLRFDARDDMSRERIDFVVKTSH